MKRILTNIVLITLLTLNCWLFFQIIKPLTKRHAIPQQTLSLLQDDQSPKQYYENNEVKCTFQNGSLANVKLKKHQANAKSKQLAELITAREIQITWPGAIPSNWAVTINDNKIICTAKTNNITYIQQWEIKENYTIAVKCTASDPSIKAIISIEKKDVVSVKHNKWVALNEKFWLYAMVKDEAITKQGKIQANENTILYIGPKNLQQLQQFSQDYDTPKITNTIPYGMFPFITKPAHYLFEIIYKTSGHAWIALLCLLLFLNLLTWPIQRKYLTYLEIMKKLAPELEEIKTKYAKFPTIIHTQQLLLYQKYKISPISAVLIPLLGIASFIYSLPIFTMLPGIFSVRMAYFPFWIQDLSATDPTYIWPLLFGLSITQQLPMLNWWQKGGVTILGGWMFSTTATATIVCFTISSVLNNLLKKLTNT